MADVSLDDYIKSKHITRNDKARNNRGRPSPRGAAGGRGGFQRQGFHSDIAKNTAARKQPIFLNRGNSDIHNRWQHDLFGSGAPGVAGFVNAISTQMEGRGFGGSGTKLLISNLDYSVTEKDLQELFGELGPLKKAALHYDRSGQSLGTAEVIYQSPGDAIRALQQYNGIPLDGRIMEIQLIGRQGNIRGGSGMGPMGPQRRVGENAGRAWMDFSSGRARAGRGFGRGPSRGGFQKRAEKPQLTQEQLDMELDNYQKD